MFFRNYFQQKMERFSGFFKASAEKRRTRYESGHTIHSSY